MKSVTLWAVKENQDIISLWPEDCEPIIKKNPLGEKRDKLWYPEWPEYGNRPEKVAQITAEYNVKSMLKDSPFVIQKNTLMSVRLKGEKVIGLARKVTDVPAFPMKGRTRVYIIRNHFSYSMVINAPHRKLDGHWGGLNGSTHCISKEMAERIGLEGLDLFEMGQYSVNIKEAWIID